MDDFDKSSPRHKQPPTPKFAGLASRGYRPGPVYGAGLRLSGVNLTFASYLAARQDANAKFKTPLATYICQWPFDSNIRKKVR
jgi:hypothetical protein